MAKRPQERRRASPGRRPGLLSGTGGAPGGQGAPRIPITKPLLGDEELEALRGPLESGWIVQGPKVEEFEGRFAAYTGAEHAVAASSCTTALHLAVAALGLKPGEEVIVPAFTWVSTANVVEYMGATVRFCDVRLDTYNIDPAAIEALVNERTVGIIPVHLFGLCAEMDAINEIARRHDLWIVEDAACALGAWSNGRHAGTMGDCGAFSFHPRKSITTGEGGMLTTADAKLDSLTRTLRDHGATRSDFDRHQQTGAFLLAEYDHLGYNYRMTDLQGALGCAQMDRLDHILSERTRLAARYAELIDGLDWLDAPHVPEGETHGWQAYVCLFRPEEPSLEALERVRTRRDTLMGRLEEEGISTRQGTHAPVGTGYYASKYEIAPDEFPVARLAEGMSLTLPLYPGMTDADQDRVVAELARAQAET